MDESVPVYSITGLRLQTGRRGKKKGALIMQEMEITTLEAFAEEVKRRLEEAGCGGKVEITDVKKNNNVRLKGICILNGASNIAPNIYLEQHYEDYKNGEALSHIVRQVMNENERYKVSCRFPKEEAFDFDRAKNRLCYRLVNREWNRERLKDMPHITFHDLAVVFFLHVGDGMGQTGSITVSNELMRVWGIEKADEIYPIAHENTQRLFPADVMDMEELLSQLIPCSATDGMEMPDMPKLYVATNCQKMDGASVLLYDGFLKGFSEQIGGDFYVLPSSVHEVIFFPAREGAGAAELREMVSEVNATGVAKEEVLSNAVYRYNAEKDCLECLPPEGE